MKKIRVLDLYCGAGGCSRGYELAGWEVVLGVDFAFQKRYPYVFLQMDVLTFLRCIISSGSRDWFDVIHASPPCQRHSNMRKGRWQDREHPELIKPTRDLIKETGKPYVIENVVGAKKHLENPVMLCGTMFGLETEHGNQLIRHRLFECEPQIQATPPPCNHNKYSAIGVYGGGQHPARQSAARSKPEENYKGVDFGINARKQVMGIDWMIGKELNQAIPPVYTKWIAEQIGPLLPT